MDLEYFNNCGVLPNFSLTALNVRNTHEKPEQKYGCSIKKTCFVLIFSQLLLECVASLNIEGKIGVRQYTQGTGGRGGQDRAAAHFTHLLASLYCAY